MSDKCKDCDLDFSFDDCPINSDREGYNVPVEAMTKYGLCFTMTEEESEQVMMSSFHRNFR